MNVFKKYCPNVWVAECDEEHERGAIIQLETKYGKEVGCEVYNLIASANGKYYYSVVKIEEKTYAERKAEKIYKRKPKNHAKKRALYGSFKRGQRVFNAW